MAVCGYVGIVIWGDWGFPNDVPVIGQGGRFERVRVERMCVWNVDEILECLLVWDFRV